MMRREKEKNEGKLEKGGGKDGQREVEGQREEGEKGEEEEWRRTGKKVEVKMAK
jgi:hypothetical protein